MIKQILSFLPFLILFTNTQVPEYFSIEGPLEFNSKSYDLRWSDKPNENYYIQEYFLASEVPEDFKEMLTIHLFDTDLQINEAVDIKIKELIERKKNDPVVQYQLIESPDGKEIIVDFILSESKEGKMTIVEFNIYHYRAIKIENKEYVTVTAYTERAYAENITPFLKDLGANRSELLNEMISFEKPSIELKEK